MKQLLMILTLVICNQSWAETDITKPPMTLLNAKGVEVATKSTAIEYAMEKASKLPDGVYTLIRPDVTITVKHALVAPNIAPVAVTGGDQIVKEGDIVFLPCNLSTDADGEIVKCEWTQTGGPQVEILYTPTGMAYYITPKPITEVGG